MWSQIEVYRKSYWLYNISSFSLLHVDLFGDNSSSCYGKRGWMGNDSVVKLFNEIIIDIGHSKYQFCNNSRIITVITTLDRSSQVVTKAVLES